MEGLVRARVPALARDDPEAQRRYNGLLEEVQRLKAITYKLLVLARADTGRLPLGLTAMGLSGVTRDVVEDSVALAPELEVSSRIPDGIVITTDDGLVRQVLYNLVSNAIKYNRPNGCIEVELERNGVDVRLVVANTSDPLHRLEPDKVFERFYRADPSRDRRCRARTQPCA